MLVEFTSEDAQNHIKQFGNLAEFAKEKASQAGIKRDDLLAMDKKLSELNQIYDEIGRLAEKIKKDCPEFIYGHSALAFYGIEAIETNTKQKQFVSFGSIEEFVHVYTSDDQESWVVTVYQNSGVLKRLNCLVSPEKQLERLMENMTPVLVSHDPMPASAVPLSGPIPGQN